MPSSDYHARQAELAARLALTESDPSKAAALKLLAMELYDKAEKAKDEDRSEDRDAAIAEDPASSTSQRPIQNPKGRIS